MPVRLQRLNGGNIPLKNSGVRVPRTAQLEVDSGSMGRAVSGVGDKLAGIAIEAQKANDARVLIESESAMREAQAAQIQFQRENIDETKWEDNWTKLSRGLEKRFGEERLTPDGRLTLEQSFSRFAETRALVIADQAFGQTKARAKMAIDQRFREFVDSGDVEGVRTIKPLMKESNLYTPEEIEVASYDAEKAAKATRANQVSDQVEVFVLQGNAEAADEFLQENEDSMEPADYQKLKARVVHGYAVKDDLRKAEEMITVDPKGAIDTLQNTPGTFSYLTDGRRIELERKAKGELARRSGAALDDIAQKIEMGEITKPEQIPTDELSPYAEFQARRVLAIKNKEASINDPDIHRQLVTQIANFTPDPEAGGLDTADLRTAIRANFTDDYQSGLLEQLDKQLEGESLDVPVAESRAIVENAIFGAEESQALDEEGFPLVKTVKEKSVRPGWFGPKTVENEKEVPVMEANPLQQAKAGEKRTAINKQVEKEIRSGQLEGDAAIIDRTIQLLRDAGFTLPDGFGGKAIPMEGEMPTTFTGADFNNPLLPYINQQAYPILDAYQ